jgi:hypothetical protein
VTIFDDDVADGLPDDAAVAELGIVQAAGDGQVQVDDAVAVLQDGDGQIQGQVLGGGAFHPLAQGQLVHDDLVLAPHLALLELVFQVQGKLAGLDLAAHEGGRVGRQPGHLHVLEHHLDVHEAGGIEHVQLPHGPGQAEFVHPAVQFQFGLAAGPVADAVDVALELVDAGAEGQGQGQVGEVHLALVDPHPLDVDPEGGIGLAAGGGLGGLPGR